VPYSRSGQTHYMRRAKTSEATQSNKTRSGSAPVLHRRIYPGRFRIVGLTESAPRTLQKNRPDFRVSPLALLTIYLG
jgi:hypothetical protein